MNYFLKLLVVALLALALHLILGWVWTIAAGVAAGLWVGRGGWHLGAAGVGFEWLAVVLYNFLVAPRAVHMMSEGVGSLLGNLPFFVVVALTLLIGALLGLLGGGAGTQIGLLLQHKKSAHVVTAPSERKHSARV